MRYTGRDAAAAFRRIMWAIEGDYNKEDVYALGETIDGQWRGIVGRYALDYSAPYGGFCIVRCSNEQGGQGQITYRMKATAFVMAADFMSRLLAEKDRK